MLSVLVVITLSFALYVWYLYMRNNTPNNNTVTVRTTTTTKTNRSINTARSNTDIKTAKSSEFTSNRESENVKTARSMQFSVCSTSSLAPLTSKHDNVSPIQFTESSIKSSQDTKQTKDVSQSTQPSISQRQQLEREPPSTKSEWPASTVVKPNGFATVKPLPSQAELSKNRDYSTSVWPGATFKF